MGAVGLAALLPSIAISDEELIQSRYKDTVLMIDCGSPKPEKWIEFLKWQERINKNLDEKIGFTYFVTVGYLLAKSDDGLSKSVSDSVDLRNCLQEGVNRGNEIATHGFSNKDGKGWNVTQWHNDLAYCDQIVASALKDVEGDPYGAIGFRAPQLGTNDAMFHALRENHYLYDCSVPTENSVNFEAKEGVVEIGVPYFKRDDGKKILGMSYNLHVHETSSAQYEKMLYDELKRDGPLFISLDMMNRSNPGGETYNDITYKFLRENSEKGALKIKTMKDFVLIDLLKIVREVTPEPIEPQRRNVPEALTISV